MSEFPARHKWVEKYPRSMSKTDVLRIRMLWNGDVTVSHFPYYWKNDDEIARHDCQNPWRFHGKCFWGEILSIEWHHIETGKLNSQSKSFIYSKGINWRFTKFSAFSFFLWLYKTSFSHATTLLTLTICFHNICGLFDWKIAIQRKIYWCLLFHIGKQIKINFEAFVWIVNGKHWRRTTGRRWKLACELNACEKWWTVSNGISFGSMLTFCIHFMLVDVWTWYVERREFVCSVFNHFFICSMNIVPNVIRTATHGLMCIYFRSHGISYTKLMFKLVMSRFIFPIYKRQTNNPVETFVLRLRNSFLLSYHFISLSFSSFRLIWDDS